MRSTPRYHMALITVVIPYHKAHAELVKQAVASCLYQTFNDIEVIVVNDSPDEEVRFADKRVYTVNSNWISRPNCNRAAIARNHGTQFVETEYVVYLDADDYLLPRALETLLRGHVTHNKSYTYSSHYNGMHHMRPPEYNQRTYELFNIHPITCLLPTSIVNEVDGFDEDAPGWEDWTLFLRLAIKGYCGEFYRGPVFVYRDEHSINHVVDVHGGQELMDKVLEPYRKNGAIQMAACCGGGDKISARRVVSAMTPVGADDSGLITLEYVGDMQGTATWRHPSSGRIYRAGRNPANRIIRVAPEDAAWLEQFKFRRVVAEQPLVPAPVAAAVVLNEQPEPTSEPESVGGMQIIDILTDKEVDAMMGKKQRGRTKQS